jgi:hypothetical protein
MPCTHDDIRTFSERIQRYWGAHLYVRVVPTGIPAMDWKTVQIPREFTGWTTARLLEVLLHEWGHRTLSPLSPARMHLWRRIAMTAGLSESQGQVVGNIAADAWVDRAYLRSRDWGQVYAEGMRDEVELLAPHLDARSPGSAAAFHRIYHSFYARLVREIGEGPPLPPDHPLLRDPASPGERAVAGGMWDIVFDDARDEETRVRDLARHLRPHLPVEVAIHVRVSLALTGVEPGGRADLDAIVELADRFGVTVADLAPHVNAAEVSRLRLRARRLELYARIVPTVKAFLGRRERMPFSGYRPWRTGRPIRELDLLATIQRSALVIPNVNTLARSFERQGTESGRGVGAVVLVVDDSGSTKGNVLEREKEAAFSVIAAARAFADEAACVVFGSGVTASIPLSSRYVSLEEAICSLSSSSGGTNLAPALREAARLVRSLDRFTILLMTDAQIYDPREVELFVRGLPEGCRIVAFAFNGAESVRNALGRVVGRKLRILAADPAVPFSERALEEIYA